VTTDLVGSVIDGWKVVGPLGRGSMGSVYDARRGKRRAALKIVLPESAADDGLPRFRREAKILMGLEHPNVIRCFGVGDHEGQVYLLLEYLGGGSLDDVQEERGRLALPPTIGATRAVLRGLGAIHAKGIVHRDLKPSNLLIDHEGRIKLADFGLARRGDASTALTATGTILGTPYYMAPEQCRGQELDGRTDLYAVGVLIYHLMSGRPPFGGTNPLAILQQHMTADVPDLRDVVRDAPAQLAVAIDRLMAKEPRDRPKTAEDALKLLEGLPEGPLGRGSGRHPNRGSGRRGALQGSSSGRHRALGSSSGRQRALPGGPSRKMRPPPPGAGSQRIRPGMASTRRKGPPPRNGPPQPTPARSAAARPTPAAPPGPRPASAAATPGPAKPLPRLAPSRLFDALVLLLFLLGAAYFADRLALESTEVGLLERAWAGVGRPNAWRDAVTAVRDAAKRVDPYGYVVAGVLGFLLLDRLVARTFRVGLLWRVRLGLRAARLVAQGETHAAAKVYEVLGKRAKGAELLLSHDMPIPAAEMFADAGLHQRQGDALMAAGRKQEALAAYRASGKADARQDAANLGDTSLDSARLLLDQGKVDEAIHVHRRAGRRYHAADLLEKEGRPQEAIRELEAAFAAGGGRDYWHHLGKKGPLESARPALARRIATLHEQADDPAGAAFYYEKAGDLPEAADLYKRLGDHRALARCLLGGVPAQGDLPREKKGRVEGAARALAQAEDPSAIDLFERAGRLEEAAAEARRHGEHARARALFERAGRKADAAAAAEAAADLDEAVRLYEEAGDHRKASALWERLEHFSEAAESARRAGDIERALDLLERGEAHLKRARLLLEHGRRDEALAALGRVPDEDPEVEDAHALRGDIHYKAKRYREAAAAYAQGIPDVIHFREQAPHVVNYSSCLAAMGDLPRAIEVLGLLEGKEFAPPDLAKRRSRLEARARGLSSSSPSASASASGGSASASARSSASASAGASSGGSRANPGDLVGMTLGPYELLRFVGEGSFAWVYEARDTTAPDRLAALKVLKPNLMSGKAPERFTREGRSLAQLRGNQHLIEVFDMGDSNGLYYLALEFVKGPTLKKLIGDEAPFPVPKAARLGVGVLSALEAAHERGVVHRDLKPANVLVDRDSQARVLDFGLARVFDDAAQSASGGYLGTPRYASPEQARGEEVGPAADQYAAALVIYEMLTGKPPFRSKTSLGYLGLHASEAPRPLIDHRKDVPKELADAIMKALEKQPSDRFPSVAAFREVVARFATRRSARGRARRRS